MLPQRTATELRTDRRRKLAMAHASLDKDLPDPRPHFAWNRVHVCVALDLQQAPEQQFRESPPLTVYTDLAQEPQLVIAAGYVERVLRPMYVGPDLANARGDAEAQQQERYAVEQPPACRSVID